MRLARSRGTVWFLGAWLAWSAVGFGADPPGSSAAATPTTAPSPSPASDAETILLRALDLERSHKWTAAIEVYEKALEQWPERTDFRHRLRLCESHYRLTRRYQDRS